MTERATARSLRIAAIVFGMVVLFAGGAAAGHINIIAIVETASHFHLTIDDSLSTPTQITETHINLHAQLSKVGV